MRLLYIFPLLAIPASIFACAASSDDEGAGSSTNAITGSVANLQACAAASTYNADGPNDFDVPASKDIPKNVAQVATEYYGSAVSHFKAPSVGDVYTVSGVSNSQGFVQLFDRNGAALAYGYQYYGQGAYYWTAAGSNLLDCSGTPYNVPAYNSSSSGYASSSGYSSSGYSSSGYTTSSGSVPTGCDAGVTYDDAGNASQASCPGH